MTPSPGYGCRSRRGWALAVRPGLKPRAESPSPLKGAVRRPGARVDRLGAGAGGISRLQPAWGPSPAVHGRAIVETAARLIRAACRARRVGHAESPRHRRGGRGSASPLQGWGGRLAVGSVGQGMVRDPPCCRGQAVPDPPAREGRDVRRGRMSTLLCGMVAVAVAAADFAAPMARAGEAAPRPYRGGVPHHRSGILAPWYGGIGPVR